MLPNFLLVGAAKSGTTALWSYLGKHPDIFMSSKKEIKYFDRRYGEGVGSYESYFARWSGQSAVGEATQTYLYLPEAPKRIAETIPDVKLMFIFRNPVDRAYSHYWHSVSRGHEYLDYETALECEEARLKQNAYCRFVFSYQDRGRYYEQVRRYSEVFQRSQMLFLLFEDLVSRPVETMREVYDFLDVDKSVASGISWQRENASRYPRSLFVQKQLNRILYRIRMFSYDHLNERRAQAALHAIRRFVTVPLRPFLLTDCRYPPMNGETRTQLLLQFEDKNLKLGELINKNVACWDR